MNNKKKINQPGAPKGKLKVLETSARVDSLPGVFIGILYPREGYPGLRGKGMKLF
jgi:hypothetical protein